MNTPAINGPRNVGSREDWLVQRKTLLAREKAFNKSRDALSAARRDLPWVPVTRPYLFEGASGQNTFADLFDGKSQLIVYHFMYGADWDAGCKSCSYWIDNFDGIQNHLAARDTALVLVSSAPYETLAAYRKRLGWTLPWFSAQGPGFNQDYGISFTPEQMQPDAANYNYRQTTMPSSEMPGASVFVKDDGGDIYHTYSTYSRGLDMLNGAYHLLDLTPKGRDENGLPGTMSWLRRHDEYE